MIEKLKNNKVLKILTMIIKAIVSLFIVIVVSIIFIQRISDNKLTLGGYSIYTIVTESMVPKYNVGDMVISKKVPFTELKVEDDITYLGNKSGFAGKIVTHQIIKVDKINGKNYLHTKGIANPVEDPLVEENQVLGKVIMKSTILSLISKVVNNPYGFYFVIFVPFAILLVMQIIDFIEEKKESKAEKNEIEKQKEIKEYNKENETPKQFEVQKQFEVPKEIEKENKEFEPLKQFEPPKEFEEEKTDDIQN